MLYRLLLFLCKFFLVETGRIWLVYFCKFSRFACFAVVVLSFYNISIALLLDSRGSVRWVFVCTFKLRLLVCPTIILLCNFPSIRASIPSIFTSLLCASLYALFYSHAKVFNIAGSPCILYFRTLLFLLSPSDYFAFFEIDY